MVITAQETKVKLGYKQTRVGVIPEDWDVKTFGAITISSQYGISSSVGGIYSIPILKMNHLQDGRIVTEHIDLIRLSKNELECWLLNQGDLLINRTNSPDLVGKTALYNLAGEHVFASYLVRFRLEPFMCPDFANYFLNSEPGQAKLKLSATKGVSQANINPSQLKRLLFIPVPSLPEQQAIATALSDVDALLASLDKLIAKKRDIKQATMQQLLTGKVRLPGFSGEWEVKKLGNVVETILGGGTPSRSKPEYWGEDIPWVTVKDFATFNPHFTQESITEVGLQNSASNLIKKGTIITSTRMAIGKAVIYEVDVSINQDLKAIFLKKDISTLFMFYWFELNAQNIENLGSGSTVKGISLSDLKNVSFLKPPIVTEQTAIATVLSDMDAEIVALEQKRDKTRALKQGMMQELLTGKDTLAMSKKGRTKRNLYAVGQPERMTQIWLIALCKNLGYRYLGDWEEREKNSNVEEEILRPWLEGQGYEKALIDLAIEQFTRAAENQSRSLYDNNKEVYSLLRYGVQVKPGIDENTVTVWLIDWKQPLKNDFAIAEEVTVKGTKTKRPDLVLYVNGIALGVLELKSSRNSVGEGIRQNILNQRKNFIGQFFTTTQLVMAANDTEGLRYGTTETREEHFLTWKEEKKPADNGATTTSNASEDEQPGENTLDLHIRQLCQPLRLLEIVHNFVVFDAGTKKLCRPNQYFGVRAAQKRVRSREGGIIWHTQGSGKSLTMVWLAKWIREHRIDARILIITDRTELDEQIEGVFKGVEEEIYRTKSGKDLITQLNATLLWLLCSLIHKFPGKEEGDIEGFIEEVKRSLPAGFKAKGDIYVFIDECHRTQSGKLHEAMKQILPNAMFIGFTGTPLLKADKQKSIEVFGSYIHTYKYDEAVKDQVVLDLRYEARDIDQKLTSQKKIDQWFAAKTQGLNDVALAQLKQKWGTMQKVLSSQSRLAQIVADIRLDMETRPRLQSGRGNAMLVSGSIYQACKLYELFVTNGFERCAIVTSYKPSSGDIRTEAISEEGVTEKLKQFEIYNKMLNGKSVEEFEKEVKKKFIDEPGQMKLLIVVDKLLTGFDAPAATYLYIDKQMRDHGLFQAICRVNRLDGADKDYGYIIDYKDLFQSLERSIHDYTSGALDGYDRSDVEGLLKDRISKGREELEKAREAIKALCEPVAASKDTPAYIRYFCGDTADKDALKEHEPRRVLLYKLTTSLIRAYANLANDMPDAGYTVQKIAQIKGEVDYYTRVRTEIKMASGDYIDLKMYEPAMRYLIDTYIHAEESETVTSFDDIPLVQLLVEQGTGVLNTLPSGISNNKQAMAETIENNMRRLIIDEMPVNPAYYARMSELLDTLILERKQQAQDYERYLAAIVELAKQVKQPGESATYPASLNTPARRAFYDNLAGNAQQAVAVDEVIKRTHKDGWRGNIMKEREVYYAIEEIVSDKAKASEILEIAKQQRDY